MNGTDTRCPQCATSTAIKAASITVNTPPVPTVGFNRLDSSHRTNLKSFQSMTPLGYVQIISHLQSAQLRS